MGAYRSFLVRTSVVALSCVSFVACGGGGGSSATPAVAQTSSSPGAVTTDSGTTVPVSITIDPTATSSSGRSAMYFSPSTQSMTISVVQGSGTPASSTVNCTSACSATVQAPLGSDVFTVSLYDRPSAAGNMLSSGSATSTIRAGVTNTVSLTMSGVVAAVTMSAPATVELGVSGTQSISITAKDADGNTISGTYYKPVTLTDTDGSGATSLSTSTISASGSTFGVTYNGSNSFSSASITASAPGMAAGSAPPISIVPGNLLPVTITAS